MKSRPSISLKVIKNIYQDIPPSGPIYANIQITNTCNLHCEFCGYHSFLNKTPLQGGHVPASRLIKAIDELGQMGTKEISLCAKGEPSYHPDFPSIVNSVKRHPMWLTIYTNFSAKNISGLESYIKADHLIINLSAFDEASYKAILAPHDPGTFNKVLDNIKAVKKMRDGQNHPHMEICYIITKNNFRQIGQAIELGASLGVDKMAFRNMQQEESTKSLVLNQAEIKEFILIILHLIKSPLPVQTNLRDILNELLSVQKTRAPFDHCFVGWFSLAIDSKEEVHFCCQHFFAQLGNLKDDSVMDIWTGQKAVDARKLAEDHFHHETLFGKNCQYCPHAGANAQIEAHLYGARQKV